MKYAFISSIFLSTIILVVIIAVSARQERIVSESEARPVPAVVETTSAHLPQQTKIKESRPAAIVLDVRAPSIQELLKKGETQAAILHLEEILKLNPSDKDALLTLAGLYLRDKGLRDKAEGILRRVLESNPENREALEKYLDLHNDPKRPGNPLESLRRLAEENPDSPNIAGAYARSLGDKGQYAEGIALLERAIENPRADALAFSSLSEYYRQIGLPGKAAESFERALQKQEQLFADLKSRNLPTTDLEQSILRSEAMLAGEFLQSRQFDRAEALIRTIAAKDPNSRFLKGLRDQLERGRSS